MRYIPHSKNDIAAMLKTIGADSVDELFNQIPGSLRLKRQLKLPGALCESELQEHLEDIASQNSASRMLSFLGAGNYKHFVPQAVDQLLLRSEFYTAYTPYQPEVSQGTLQAIFEFQTMVCRLFDMHVANASMYDGGTAVVEAALMARRVQKKKNKIVVSAGVHPEYIQILETYLNALDDGFPNMVIVPLDNKTGSTDLAALAKNLNDAACVIVGYPNFYGVVEPLDDIVRLAKEKGALTITSTLDAYAFGVVAPPGQLGADIATAEGQSLGPAISYGGPGVGLFAVSDDKKLLRSLPGRLVGQTKDIHGETGYVLTLSTREQHIRREKATSNICTNHGLCALAVGINMSLLGKQGYIDAAGQCLSKAVYLKTGINSIDGFKIEHSSPTFNEFVVRCKNQKAAEVLKSLQAKNILGGVDLARFNPEQDHLFLVAVTELHSKKKLDTFLDALKNI